MTRDVPRLLVAAAHKSSGKTTVSVGLAAALAARGVRVQPFKKGPDYIDPMWLGLAAGRDCLNLDAHLMSADALDACFAHGVQGTRGAHSAHGAHDLQDLHDVHDVHDFHGGAQLALIEGNHGLFDGLSLDGRDSNAALARHLGAPVLLVIDVRGMTRGIAPLLLGYQAFDRELRIGGVILNRVGGARHESKLRAVIEHYCDDIPVLGAVADDPRLAVVERHLGLMPCAEAGDAHAKVRAIGDIVGGQVDLDRIAVLAASAPPMPIAHRDAVGPDATRANATRPDVTRRDVTRRDVTRTSAIRSGPTCSGATRPDVTRPDVIRPDLTRPCATHSDVRIGIARDRAFGFYYPDDLDALRGAGADLVFFDTLRDTNLPPVNGLFIGGGFPESCMDALEANAALRRRLRTAIEGGLPTYAECAGLMFLSRSLTWQGRRAEMVGVIPGDAVMHERPVGRGYVQLEGSAQMPWPALRGQTVRAHEFHYSSLENLDPVAPGLRFAWHVRRGHGIDGKRDGVVMHRLLASYAHLRSAAGTDWARHFVAWVRHESCDSIQPINLAPAFDPEPAWSI